MTLIHFLFSFFYHFSVQSIISFVISSGLWATLFVIWFQRTFQTPKLDQHSIIDLCFTLCSTCLTLQCQLDCGNSFYGLFHSNGYFSCDFINVQLLIVCLLVCWIIQHYHKHHYNNNNHYQHPSIPLPWLLLFCAHGYMNYSIMLNLLCPKICINLIKD